MTSSPVPWTSTALGLTVSDVASVPDWSATSLVIPGLRRNPRRAHLLVSTALGKHIPTDPRHVRAGAQALSELVVDALARLAPDAEPSAATVFGFAETATGLGHGVAAALRSSCYLQSTRRSDPDVVTLGEFTEGHSHATRHLIQPTSAALFSGDAATTHTPRATNDAAHTRGPANDATHTPRPPSSDHEPASERVSRCGDTPSPTSPLVLVDDEISTGATALDAIAALHAIAGHRAYVVASLVDMRTADDRATNAAAAAALGVDVEFVSLATGSVSLPAGLPSAVADLAAAPLNLSGTQSGSTTFCAIDWPTGVPDGGRFGFCADDYAAFDDAVQRAAAQIDASLPPGDVVVVGHEELMYLPQRIAEALTTTGRTVGYQTTTRSPAVVIDEPGYPLRRGFEFIAPEADPSARRYLYNATLSADRPTPIALIVDGPADSAELRAPGGLLDVLTRAGHDVLVAVVPTPTQHDLREQRSGSEANR